MRNLFHNDIQIFLFLTVGKDSAIANAGKAFGRHMCQKPPDKLIYVHGDDSLVMVICIIPAGNRYSSSVIGENPTVGNCRTKSVTGKILYGIPVALKGTDDVSYPFERSYF